jgi:hypothetical protein
VRVGQVIAKLQALRDVEAPATNAVDTDPVVIRIDLGPDQDFHVTDIYVDEPADYEERDSFVVIEGGPVILPGDDLDAGAGDDDPELPCTHRAANIIAVLGPSGPHPDNPAAQQTWWPTDADHYRTVAPLGILTARTAVTYLGLCSWCSAPVVRVQTWPAARTSPGGAPEAGAGWSTPWTPLHADGPFPDIPAE